MVILMVITCACVLFQVFYFILDVTFLEFTYIPVFYWILKDVSVMSIFFHYYLDIITKSYLDIKVIMLRKHFVILRVSGLSSYGMYHLEMYSLFLFILYII